jgi:hypothetical protein
MPKFRITSPDGRTFDVTAPDGATQDQVMAYVQAQHAQAPKQTAAEHYADLQQQAGTQSPEEAARAEYDAMPLPQRMLVSAGGEGMSLARGVAQFVTPNSSDVHKRLVAASDADAAAQDGMHGVANFAGRALPYLATLPLGGPELAAGRGIAARVGLGALEGAGYGAAQETRTGESRGQNMLAGAALGGGGAGLAAGLRGTASRAANAIKPEVRAVWEKAKSLGIDLTPAQLSDSRLMKYMQSQFGLLPFSGAQAKSEQQVGQWNRKLAEAIGVDAPAVTPEVYANKKAADSAAFNDLTSRNSLNVTPDLARSLHAIAEQAKMAGKDVHDAVNSAIEGLYSQMQDGTVPGRAYQALDSALGNITKTGTPVAHFVGMARSAIRDAMDASISPEDAAAWKQLRQQYGARKTITPIVDPNGGPISPQALMSRVKATKAGKERMASGEGGVLGDLAAVGQRMKPPPSSGTAERMLVNDLANPFKWPGLVLGASAGRATNSNLLARRMMSPDRGQTANLLAALVAQSPKLSPLMIAAMAQQQQADPGNSP